MTTKQPTKTTRCHARFHESPYQRCELSAGHDDEHTVSTSWDEDECWDPDAVLVQAVPSILTQGIINRANVGLDAQGDLAYQDVPLPPASWEGPVKPGGCFSCGCQSDEHPCDAHDCRTFIL